MTFLNGRPWRAYMKTFISITNFTKFGVPVLVQTWSCWLEDERWHSFDLPLRKPAKIPSSFLTEVERERERERERDRERDREAEQRQRETETERYTHTDRDRERHRETETERGLEKEKE